ncbi:Proline--tRNA ligase [Pelotomaculum sp. FP]|nr:Proline--tRNA ligase [Pelotomaculum sp. FP]
MNLSGLIGQGFGSREKFLEEQINQGGDKVRLSKMFLPTLREIPTEAETISHKLMLRAGLVRRTAAGVYSYLPMGYRVIRKIEQIVREEMNRQGGQEFLLPVLNPAELWQQTGRWDVYGDELFRLCDRQGRNYCLGPTHEEIITTIAHNEINSYRQLPQLWYQIQTKFRDEIRPRFGLMRAREFIMKDLYSFDRDEAGLHESYMKMHEGYTRAFTRAGLTFRVVEADPGAIGGKGGSHEFMVMADNGEAEILYCDGCEYGANVEKAVILPTKHEDIDFRQLAERELVYTPNCRTIEDVGLYLHHTADKAVKSVIYETEKEEYPVVLVLVRGDHQVNEIKVKNLLDCLYLSLAREEVVNQVTGADVGYAGPIGLKEKIKIIADPWVYDIIDGECGGNKTDHHWIHITPLRDFKNLDIEVADVRMAAKGEPCPRCGKTLNSARGIEVGHIFKLGTKYSESLHAIYTDEDGKEKTIAMGCYGIGIGRTMAAAIEQNYDQNGIIWPAPIAPYHVIITPISIKEPEQKQIAEEIYTRLGKAGVEVILDDRDERPGVKFKDADLIGIPLRITVSPKYLAVNKVEFKVRKTGEACLVDIDRVVDEINAFIEANMIKI